MHYYKILKHKAGFDEGTSYWEKLLARYLAATGGGKIHTTLPITFTSTSWKLASWTIYGNNTAHNYSAEGTLPLSFTTQTAGNAADWSISGNDNVGKNLLDIESATVSPHTTIGSVNNSTGSIEVTAESGYTYRSANIILTDILEVGKKYTITFIKNNVTSSEQKSNCTIRRADTYAIIASVGYENFEAAGAKSFNYTHTQERAESGVYFSLMAVGNSSTGGTVSVSNLMLREQDASATFEPYQVGVGQRTVNLFNATIEQGGINRGAEYGSNTRIRTTFMPNMLDAGTYTVNASGVNNVVVNYFDDNKTYAGGITTWRTLPLTFNVANRHYVRFAFKINDSQNVTPSDISNIMLVKGSTAPQTFIPYGYQVPLTVSQTGQTDKNYDIFIGNSPLTEGETVSKTSTGVDIAAIAGSNTISTDLYNKPSMSITGVDYVGVGQRTANLFDKDDVETGAYDSQTGEKIDAPALKRTPNPFTVDGGTVYRISNAGGSIRVFEYQNDGTYIGASLVNTTFTTSANTGKINLHGMSTYFTETMMLTKGSTAPQTYIPYGYEIPMTVTQQGQTTIIANAELEQGHTGTDTTKTYEQNKINSTNRLRTPSLITINKNIPNVISISDGFEFAIRWYSDGLYASATGWYTHYTIPSNFVYNSFGLTIRKPDNSDITNAESITITIQEEAYKNYNIYIGNSPLTEGQTVSNTMEIEVFEGENTIDTTLYNKPEMEIIYE